MPEIYRESLQLNIINPKIGINHTYGELIKIIKGETPPLEDDYKWVPPISINKKEENNYIGVTYGKLLEDSINDDNTRKLLLKLTKTKTLE